MAGIYVPTVFNTPDIFVSFFSTFFSSFFSFFLLHSPMSLFCNKTFQERYSQELGAFIWWNPNKHVFVFTPSVGVKHFEVDEKHIFAYFQCRSITYMWRVRDLDLGNMINLLTRVNKTRQNSTLSKQLMWKVFNETNIWL